MPSVASLKEALSRIPSVDRLLNGPAVAKAIERYGRDVVLQAVREVVDEARSEIANGGRPAPDIPSLTREATARVERWFVPAPRRVFNLTGTVLHTNLGRSPLPPEALQAMADASGASNVEFDLEAGRRGERDADAEAWLRRLTGAEAAVIVNNNAAAVLLILNSLASGKEVRVSRGELVEIGGGFRMPDIMKRAGCRLREVGTTNRTHARDYEEGLDAKTALLMKVRTSNYEIQGFTAAVPGREIARIAHRHEKLMFVDLGSGALVDLEQFGLPHEPTPREALADGADLVSFSGDKLLGGPQVGVIVGRQGLVARIRRNPLLRALRADKLRLAALSAVLRLYADPQRLIERVPALRLLARSVAEIEALVATVQPVVAGFLAGKASVEAVRCESQVGSGAHPLERLPSAGLRITPGGQRRPGRAAMALAQQFRALPIPVVGRVEKDALMLDFRGFEQRDRDAFIEQLRQH